ncbi:hypothetical protein PPERSA_04341 [Pseudocohnilembus persalinus]|uniref:Uncharacterized protein n=1 Tax=Pseudocohnilembus persalinus TaxID=266149 RepID=A0A0V0QQE6_PSEPJ|nr:hypothetical protein PPERSA_04341 [Pseudocohnilembus persalinus]|eukprot:KRX04526.1 hypothetical protein PPERSA_04341 [Pseudocohnilembus persalinus]
MVENIKKDKNCHDELFISDKIQNDKNYSCDLHFFDYNFDKMKDYQQYFQHGNHINVIENLRQQQILQYNSENPALQKNKLQNRDYLPTKESSIQLQSRHNVKNQLPYNNLYFKKQNDGQTSEERINTDQTTLQGKKTTSIKKFIISTTPNLL